MTLKKYGRYETLHRIASGGMASVYLGRHVGAGGFERLVAIKVMHDHIAEDPSFSTMFLDEARLAAKIRHPNVVPTLDVADDGRYIVMEYVEGASLQAILVARANKKQGPIPLPIALRIFLDALAGLHAAHELRDQAGKPLKLVHRDVSPHNVLVGVDGMSRITDFGIAFAEARLTSTKSGQLKGKLPYMAPEQLEDAELTRKTDVYAAGCVLWEMLAGQRLFKGKSEAAVACAVLAGPERTVSDVRGDIPKAIDDACMRALTSADVRYETALAFAEALEVAADAVGVNIARHRQVGPVARLEQMTYPAASTLTESDDDPRPKELMAALSEGPPTRQLDEHAQAAPPMERAETPPTERGETSPARISQTLVAEAGTPMELPGKTTARDRPPPEVAEVIRAAIQAPAEPDEELPEPSVMIPKQRSWGSLLAAGVVACVFGGGTLWMATREEPTSEVPPRDAAPARSEPQVHTAGSTRSTPSASAPPPKPESTAASSAAGTASSNVPTPPTPRGRAWPKASPRQPPPTVAPKNTSDKYHGEAP